MFFLTKQERLVLGAVFCIILIGSILHYVFKLNPDWREKLDVINHHEHLIVPQARRGAK